MKLAEACIGLMLDVGYERISVRGLARRAGVGSSTFYRHFQDKDDLLLGVVLDEMQRFKDALAPARSPREEAALLFSYARRNPKVIRFYASLPHGSRAQKAAKQELANMVQERYRPRDEATVDPEIASNHICIAYYEVVMWYLNNLDRYSPEDIAQICGDLVVRAAVDVAFVPREDWLQRFE